MPHYIYSYYILHTQLCFLRLLLVVTVSHTFLVLDDLDNFEECWLDILSFHWDLSDILMIRLWLPGFGEKDHKR